MSLIPFPDVPQTDGVPSVLRNVNAAAVAKVAALVPGGSVLLSGYLALATKQWGVYDSTGGNKMLTPDSFVAFDFNNSVNLPTFPMEVNSFQNYNKVQTPYVARIAMAVDSGLSARSSFITDLDVLLAEDTVCMIVTPEKVLSSVTLAGYGYRKTAVNGVSCLVFDTMWQEIRATATQAGSNTSSAYSTAATSNGQVQASDATTSQETAVTTASDGSTREVQ